MSSSTERQNIHTSGFHTQEVVVGPCESESESEEDTSLYESESDSESDEDTLYESESDSESEEDYKVLYEEQVIIVNQILSMWRKTEDELNKLKKTKKKAPPPLPLSKKKAPPPPPLPLSKKKAQVKATKHRIVLTPINLVDKLPKGRINTIKARADYRREEKHFIGNGHGPKWDDSTYNNAEVGDMFGFVQNGENKIEYFRIEEIIPVQSRPDYWDIPEHQRRQVLKLSKRIRVGTFTEYKTKNNYKDNFKQQGTQRMRYKL